MRLATISTPSGLRLAVLANGGYIDVANALRDETFTDLTSVLAKGPMALDQLRPLGALDGVPYQDSLLGPAVPRPGRIFCLGLNYAEHAAEGGRSPGGWPESFLRTTSSIVAPFGNIVKPQLSSQLDFEGELGIVIGKGGRYICADKALESIAGYVVINDVSARDWQRAGSQWTGGKNFDQTMPIGPVVVTSDEIDPTNLLIQSRLNGQIMQQERTSAMILDVAHAVEFFSSVTKLLPGDLISTGTPSGTGFARTPPVYLQPGDLIEVTIENIGTISNHVVAELDQSTSSANWPWTPPAREGASI